MADLAKYVVSLEAQSQVYVRELEKANRKLDTFHKQQTKSLDTIKRGFVALGTVVSVRMFAGFIKSSIDAADETVKLSQKVGVAAETLQGLALGADLAGVGAAGLQTGLVRLNRSIADAAQGLASQQRAFEDLNVSVFNTDGTLRGTESVLRDVADRFAALEDGVKKTARAQELFGRSGADLIPLLNEGSQGIDKMIDRAQRLGIVWSDDAAKAAEQFNDNLTLLGAVGRGVASTMAQELLPAMNSITAAMVTFAEQGEVSTRLGSALSLVLKTLAHVAIGLGYGIVSLADHLAGKLAAIVALGTDGIEGFKTVMNDLALSQRELELEMQGAFKNIWEGASASAEQSLTEMRTMAVAAFGEIATAAQTDAIDKQIQALETEAATFGMTKAEATLYRMELQGATADQLAMAQGSLNLIAALQQQAEALKNVQLTFADFGVDLQTLSEPLMEAHEIRRQFEQDFTDFLSEEHNKRLVGAQQAATAEAQAVIDSQIQQLDFRAAVAQHAASLIQGVFGMSKAVQLASIAFEKLLAVRRLKLAVDLAAWQAFQSQLIPGVPASAGAAAKAYAAVKARGAVSIAQTAALSALSGLAEASHVLQSSGALGSFTNPVNTQAGSSAAPGAAAANREQRVVQVHFHGNVFGWDDYVRNQVISGIRSAVDDGDVILFSSHSRQAQDLIPA
jgi:hypothetical protein